jgi:hypothetical protein
MLHCVRCVGSAPRQHCDYTKQRCSALTGSQLHRLLGWQDLRVQRWFELLQVRALHHTHALEHATSELAFAVPSQCRRRFAPWHCSALVTWCLVFVCWLVWESFEQTTAMSPRKMNKSRRVVLVSTKPVAGRIWKSLTWDVCIETHNLLEHWLAWQALCGSLGAASIHINLQQVRGH